MPFATFTLTALIKASNPFVFFFKFPLHIFVPSIGTLLIISNISKSLFDFSVIVQMTLEMVGKKSPSGFIFKLAAPPVGSD